MASSGSLASIVVQISADASDFLEGMSAASKAAKDFGETGAIVAGAGTAILGVLTALTESTAKYETEIYNAQQKTGLASDTLSGLKLAAESVGGSIDDVTNAMRKLSTDAESAATGTGKQADLFKQLGVSATDADGSVKPLNELFPEVADALSNVTNKTQLTSDAVALFGRGGTALIPIIADGTAGMQEWSDTAAKLGVSVTDSEAAQAKAFEESQKTAEAAFQGIELMIGNTLMPSLMALADGIGGVLVAFRQWAAGHQEIIQAAELLGVALLGTGGVALAIAAVTAAVGLLITPIGLAAAAIVAFTAGMAEFPKFRDTVVGVLHDVVEGATAMGSVLGTVFEATYQALTGNLKEAWGTLSSVGTKALDDASAAGDGFDKAVTGISSAITGGQDAFQKFLKNTQDVGGGLPPVSAAAKQFQDAVDKLVDSVTEEIKKGPELVAALDQMTVSHTNADLIIDKLGTKIVTLVTSMQLEGQQVDAVTKYYYDLTVARNTDNDTIAKQFDASVKIGQAMENNAAQLQKYMDVQGDSDQQLQLISKDWDSYYKTLDQLVSQELNTEQDAAKQRIDLINQELTADTTYNKKIQDLTQATQQMKEASDDAFKAYHQSVLDYESGIDAGYSTGDLKMIQDQADQELKTWKEYQTEYEKLQDETNKTVTGYYKTFYTSQDQAMQNMEKSMSQAMGSITTGIATDIAQDLVQWQNFGDSLTKLGQDVASKMLSAFLTGLFNPLTNAMQQIGKSLADSISNALGSSFGGGGNIFSSILGSIIGFFDEGTAYVPQTGLAVVHQGERIITAADNATLMNGGSVSIPGLSSVGGPSGSALGVSSGADPQMAQNNTLLAAILSALNQGGTINLNMDGTKVGQALYKGTRFNGLQIVGAQ